MPLVKHSIFVILSFTVVKLTGLAIQEHDLFLDEVFKRFCFSEKGFQI
jgi:hypothetical protein